jgi:GNAT superfamily N-acetyltransferase
MPVRAVMHRDLRTVPPAWRDAPGPPGVAFEGPGRSAAELVPAFMAAYPPGHPDHAPGWDPEFEAERILSGIECGPLMGYTRFAVADGVVVGAVLVTDAPGNHPIGAGPLVADVFRHPDRQWRGLGRTLLQRALAEAAGGGHAQMGLLVTGGNPAQGLYASLGFAVTETFERY